MLKDEYIKELRKRTGERSSWRQQKQLRSANWQELCDDKDGHQETLRDLDERFRLLGL